MTLAELQELFVRAIAWPTGVADFLAQADAETVAAFHDTFAETEALSRVERVNIYAESYFWRLFETLKTQFPVTAWLAGEVDFRNIVTDYVLEHPSRDPDLRRFGAVFPRFVDAHALAERHPYLAFCAQVEERMASLLDAEDRTPIAPMALANIPAQRWPGLRFKAAPTLRLLSSRWRFSPLSEAYRAGPQVPPALTEAADENVYTLLWREKMRVMHRSVPRTEAEALAAMVEGRTFTEICAAAAAEGADVDAVASWLRRWIDAELIIGASG